MLDTLTQQFLQNPTENTANNILQYTYSNKLYAIGIVLGYYFSKIFPYSLCIKESHAVNAYYATEYEKAFDILENALQFRGLNEETSFRVLFNQHFSINHVENRYIDYNQELVNSIKNKPPAELPLITLSITTCKRFDLFEKTMNSLLHCLDVEMVDTWLCVDDNSSEEDKEKMKTLYPFFNFIWKDQNDKGHPRSMNIIKNYVKTPYLLHLEDDWKFFVKKNYIKDSLDVLSTDSRIGQCLFNKNYSEIESDIGIKGGLLKLSNGGIRYFEHEYVVTDKEKFDWYKKYGNSLSSNYWPHFSLRPSLIRTSIFHEIGDFNEAAGHFEMEYAHRYVSKNYISVFFEGIYSLHTGRLTSEKFDDSKINAYKLNNEDQFVKNKKLTPVQECCEIDLSELGINLKTYVLNLDRRPDRWEKFVVKAQTIEFLNYERFSAVDGSKLQSTQQLQRIFDGNDYNMKVGAVGCAMSHFKMYTELIYSDKDAYVILEDDIEIARDFDVKFLHLCNQLKNLDWDVVFLGNHPKNREDARHKEDKIPIIEKWDVYTSFQNSVGGTIGYMISKKGAERVLDFINENRLINCIDTALQKCCNELDVYYSVPHLIFSECFRNDIHLENFDTDIQHNFESLTIPLATKVKDEIAFYAENKVKTLKYTKEEFIIEELKDKNEVSYYLGTGNDIRELKKLCVEKNVRYYTYDEKVIFIVPESINTSRYFHIFKVNDKYNIDDCF